MKSLALLLSLPCLVLADAPKAEAPVYPRPLQELNKSYFPFHSEGLALPEGFEQRKQATRERILLACGLLPLPTKTPLNPVIHGRVEAGTTTPLTACSSRASRGSTSPAVFTCRSSNPRRARCLACCVLTVTGRTGVSWTSASIRQRPTNSSPPELSASPAVRGILCKPAASNSRAWAAHAFLYDMIGYADSIQIPEHRSGRREALNGKEPGTYGLYAMAAEHR